MLHSTVYTYTQKYIVLGGFTLDLSRVTLTLNAEVVHGGILHCVEPFWAIWINTSEQEYFILCYFEK